MTEGFIGRRREQQRLVPALRSGETYFLVLQGVGGQGKSTLATRLVNRLQGSGYHCLSIRAERYFNRDTKQYERTVTEAADDLVTILLADLHSLLENLGKNDLVRRLSNPEHDHAKRLGSLVLPLDELPIVVVLDNLEDALDDQQNFANETLKTFYTTLQRGLTGKDRGCRVIVTSRHTPRDTRETREHDGVRVLPGLNDFRLHDFFKFLKREPVVAERIASGELPPQQLEQVFQRTGGTPRLLKQIRSLLKDFSADELTKALQDGGKFDEQREDYLQSLFGQRLYDKLDPHAQTLANRLAVTRLPVPMDACQQLIGADDATTRRALQQATERGMLQAFTEAKPTLYQPTGVWRPWLERRLDEPERRQAHSDLAAFWRQVYDEDREEQLRIGWMEGLDACREHARPEHGAAVELFRWANLSIARTLQRRSEFRAALQLLLEVPKVGRDAAVLKAMGDALESLSLWKEAEACYQIVLRELTADDGTPLLDLSNERLFELASMLHAIATIEGNRGDFDAAVKKLQESLKIRRVIGDRVGEAATLANLGGIDISRNRYDEAEKQYQVALDILLEINDPRGQAATWHQLASIDLQRQDYDAAEKKFYKSLKINEKMGDRSSEAATWHQLATIDYYRDDYELAEKKFHKSLKIKQEIGDRVGEATTWHALASIELNYRGDYDSAAEIFRTALTMRQEIGDRVGEAATWHQLGFVAWKRECNEVGVRLVALSFIINQAIGHGDAQHALPNVLNMCEELGKTEEQIQLMIAEVGQSYLNDSGQALLDAAFRDSH